MKAKLTLPIQTPAIVPPSILPLPCFTHCMVEAFNGCGRTYEPDMAATLL
jgi:hypothetical protein